MKTYFLLFAVCCLPLSTILSQDQSSDFLKAIIHLHNDKEINEKVTMAFESRIKKQQLPVAYSIADSLTFIDIGNHLPSKFDVSFGLDSMVFRNRLAYRKLYFHKNIPFPHSVSNPSYEEYPLHIFMSKRVGNIIAMEVTDDQEYPVHQIIQMGRSVIIILLVDEAGKNIENIAVDMVDKN